MEGVKRSGIDNNWIQFDNGAMFLSQLAFVSLLAFWAPQVGGGFGELTFDSFPVGACNGSICADLDGDGLRDLIATEYIGSDYEVAAYSAGDGGMIWRTRTGDTSPWALRNPPDIDLDGVPDVFLMDNSYDSNKGRVFVLSGLDGTLLWEKLGSSIGGRLGAGASFLADRNFDGVIDILVGEGWGVGGNIHLLSGADGGAIVGPFPNSSWSIQGQLHEVGDFNGDGLSEVYVSMNTDLLDPDFGVGVQNPFQGISDGYLLDALDLTLNGTSDLVFFDEDEVGSFYDSGAIEVYDGDSGALLRRHFAGEMISAELSMVWIEGKVAGVVYVRDSHGQQHNVVLEIDSGRTLFSVPFQEIVDNGPGFTTSFRKIQDSLTGGIRVLDSGGFSMECRYSPFISLTNDGLSQSQGGIVELHLDFPSRLANRGLYQVLVSTKIGSTFVGWLEVPLGMSPLLISTYFGDYSGIPLSLDMIGQLSEAGDMVAAVGAFPGDIPISAIGASIHFAAVVKDDPFSPNSISSAFSSLQILP